MGESTLNFVGEELSHCSHWSPLDGEGSSLAIPLAAVAVLLAGRVVSSSVPIELKIVIEG